MKELIKMNDELGDLLHKAEEMSRNISKMWSEKVRKAEKNIDAAFDNNDRDAYSNAMADYNMAVAKYEAFKRITHDINDINLK